jgi:hypothetical protein
MMDLRRKSGHTVSESRKEEVFEACQFWFKNPIVWSLEAELLHYHVVYTYDVIN